MSHVGISPRLLHLPIESVHRILDDLDSGDILPSVREEYSRLNAITATYHPCTAHNHANLLISLHHLLLNAFYH